MDVESSQNRKITILKNSGSRNQLVLFCGIVKEYRKTYMYFSFMGGRCINP